MDKNKVIDSLKLFKDRLTGEVLEAFHSRGNGFGQERFDTWRRKFSQFLDDNLPGESSILNAKLTHYAFSVSRFESDAQRFWKQDGETM
ncbi:TPA: TIR domain-containing protein, partial [Serratia fonticola]